MGQYILEVQEFIDGHYHSQQDIDKIIELLMEKFRFDETTALAHINRFDVEMQTYGQIEP
jgi:hypothetical protein